MLLVLFHFWGKLKDPHNPNLKVLCLQTNATQRSYHTRWLIAWIQISLNSCNTSWGQNVTQTFSPRVWHVHVTCHCYNSVDKPIVGLPCDTILSDNSFQRYVAASSRIICQMWVILSKGHVTVTSLLVSQELGHTSLMLLKRPWHLQSALSPTVCLSYLHLKNNNNK